MEDKKLDALPRGKRIQAINKEIEKLEKIQHETKDVYTFAEIGRNICIYEELLLIMEHEDIIMEHEDIQLRTKMYVDMMVKYLAKDE